MKKLNLEFNVGDEYIIPVYPWGNQISSQCNR